MTPHAPILALHLASLACALGALDGAYGLIAPRGAARGPGLELAEGASQSPLRALAGARMISHAATLAVIWTAPAIGACMAAALGAGWLGAAAGRAISFAVERRRARERGAPRGRHFTVSKAATRLRVRGPIRPRRPRSSGKSWRREYDSREQMPGAER